MKTLTLLATTALFAAAGTSNAQSRDGGSFYVGADVGYGQFDRDVEQESGSVSYGLRLGYNFSNHFALEATYTDHGKYGSGEGIACPGSCPDPSFSAIDTAVRSHGINAVATWPTSERTRLKALLGYTQHRAEIVDRSLSQKLDGPLLGIGFGARVTDKLDVNAEWSISLLSGENLDTAWARHMDGNTSMASLGLRWRF